VENNTVYILYHKLAKEYIFGTEKYTFKRWYETTESHKTYGNNNLFTYV